jgi:hypothetical protein
VQFLVPSSASVHLTIRFLLSILRKFLKLGLTLAPFPQLSLSVRLFFNSVLCLNRSAPTRDQTWLIPMQIAFLVADLATKIIGFTDLT